MEKQSRLHRFITLVGKPNYNELYILLLVTIGIPAIFYIYIDWKAALVSFVLTQLTLSVLRERLK